MSKKYIILIIIVGIMISIPIIKTFYYFNIVYFDESFKNKICKNFSAISSVEIVTGEKKSIIFENKNFINDFKSKLLKNCNNRYNKYLVERHAISIIKCKINGEMQVYLRIVKLKSGVSFIDFHRGGFFSLIGTVEDTSGLYDFISQELIVIKNHDNNNEDR